MPLNRVPKNASTPQDAAAPELGKYAYLHIDVLKINWLQHKAYL